VGKFLGYLISKTKRVVQPANIKAFKDKIRAVTKIRGGQALSQAIDQLRPIINGWYEYFKLQTNAKLFKGLDGWTRRRVRACAYQSLGNGGRRLEVFQQNGIRYNEAYPAAYSSRGAWHNSHCRTMQTWLCNRVLAEMGLVSLVREVRPER
jgi:RNA-directed DNA polymerase